MAANGACNLYFQCSAEGELALNDESIEAAWISREDASRYDLSFRNDEGLARYWAEG
jgi:hypothetical protein